MLLTYVGTCVDLKPPLGKDCHMYLLEVNEAYKTEYEVLYCVNTSWDRPLVPDLVPPPPAACDVR